MINWLLNPFTFILKSYRQQKIQTTEKYYYSQSVALPYVLLALLFFGLQGLVATMGAIDLFLPDLPGPLKFEVGRAIHLDLSVYWPLMGIMGIVYFFFIQEAETEIFSVLLAWLQFFLYLLTGFINYPLLLFGLLRGTEYQETFRIMDIGILLTLIIFAYNLLRTYLKTGVPRNRVTLVIMLVGTVSLLILYIPNTINYLHPTIREIIRFWVVHLWEEMSKELLVIGSLTAFFLANSNVPRSRLEKPLFLQAILLIISATLATGHHYYWIGTPYFWLWVGGIFSIFQLGAIFLMGYIAYLGLRNLHWSDMNTGTKLALGFILGSVIHHLAGAGLLGFTISIPQLNRYCHGTYLTSAHAHLAVFGALGMFILGGSIHILTKEYRFTKWESRLGWMGFILINLGLLSMGSLLIVAGLIQTYLWRVVGIDFTTTFILLRPYLFLRALGGALFATGDLLFIWANLSLLWRNRLKFIKKTLLG
ncbi:MAG: cbb3-type cytochrome c oxidase subunit I [Peptococcales bacterium]|jgi:nitric oxide reductase subunit B